MFKDKTVVVGITGGIAAYKAAELVSRMKKAGAHVICVMTKSAQEFITPLTLRTLSQNPVYTDLFAEPLRWDVEHIALADQADLFLVAPATANILGKVCHGIADDFLSTTIMATKAPVLFAPAMNVNMYANPVTQANINKLSELGYHFVEPGTGMLACGYEGQGRLAEIDDILEAAEFLLAKEKPLDGQRVLITAGPTRESLDPVRFITNHSSGKMGYAIAKQACLLGAEVTLISGPSNLKAFRGVKLVRVQSAKEMEQAVLQEYPEAQIVIKAAAVADYRPKFTSTQKIKKQEGDLILELERNTDILAQLGKDKGNRVLVGFAAETEAVLENAAAKMQRKNLDLIIANDVTASGAGFASDTNIVTIIRVDGTKRKIAQMSKADVALEILGEIIKIKNEKE